MTTVHMRHVRQADLCASGTRAWFKHHGINYTDFLNNGVDSEVLLKLDDHFANLVVAKAKEEQLKEVSDGQG